MALSDFFRINFPYGIIKDNDGKWFAHNREYVPLGWNRKEHNQNNFKDFPLYTMYKGLTENEIIKIIKNQELIQRNDNGEIIHVFFYDDRTNPQSSPQYWNNYFEIIKAFSQFETLNS